MEVSTRPPAPVLPLLSALHTYSRNRGSVAQHIYVSQHPDHEVPLYITIVVLKVWFQEASASPGMLEM